MLTYKYLFLSHVCTDTVYQGAELPRPCPATPAEQIVDTGVDSVDCATQRSSLRGRGGGLIKT